MDVPWVAFVQQVRVEAASGSQWLQFFAGPLTGGAVALLATWLAHRFAAKREEGSTRRASAESNRVEHLKRQLAALEQFAEAAIGMTAEFAALYSASYQHTWEAWMATYTRGDRSADRAAALRATYFDAEFIPEWGKYIVKYREGVGAVTKIAHAAEKRRNLASYPELTSLSAQENWQQASIDATPYYGELITIQADLLAKVTQLSSRLRKYEADDG